jgi:hypothetical protein
VCLTIGFERTGQAGGNEDLEADAGDVERIWAGGDARVQCLAACACWIIACSFGPSMSLTLRPQWPRRQRLEPGLQRP